MTFVTNRRLCDIAKTEWFLYRACKGSCTGCRYSKEEMLRYYYASDTESEEM